MLVVAVISVDAYLFFGFSDLTCHLEDMEIGVFPDSSKETGLRNCDQEASPSADKNSL